jgi:phosphomannomutase
MDYTDVQVTTSRLPRVRKTVALVALIIGAGATALVAFGNSTQVATDVEFSNLLTMSAPMGAANIQKFTPMLRAAGIAGTVSPASLRMPLNLPPGSSNFPSREMVATQQPRFRNQISPMAAHVQATATTDVDLDIELEELRKGDMRSQEFTPEQAYAVGQRFVRWLVETKGLPSPISIAVGRDPRLNGEVLTDATISGMLAEGAEPVRLGLATTPATFSSTFMGDLPSQASVMITASHLPPEYNGMKFFTSDGFLSKADVREMLTFSDESQQYSGVPSVRTPVIPFMASYKASLVAKMREVSGGLQHPLQGLHIVLNAANGAGGIMTEVLEALGADTSGSVNLKPDGAFPVCTPNPENAGMVKATVEAVKASGADVGVMVDTGVDRSGLIDGKTLEPLNEDRLIAAASRMVLRDYPGSTIVTDSVASNRLTEFIEAEGGKHFRYKRGYWHVIDKARELCSEGIMSPLAMETSGHGALKDNRWNDDGAFLALRLLTLLGTMRREDPSVTLMSLISGYREPEERLSLRLTTPTDCADFSEKRGEIAMSLKEIVERLVREIPEWSVDVPNHEGTRVRIAQPGGGAGQAGWFILRESGHEPYIVVNIESDTEGGAARVLEALMRGGLESLESVLDISQIRQYLKE